jgi:serine/threonine protein kinase
VKLLPPGQSGEIALRRFEREVQLTSLLTHPNTVAIYDYGRTPQGTFYYAMEYLDGLSLEDLVRLDGPQPPGRVVHFLRQLCGALEEAHGVGLIHRDIKPANIIVCERGGLPDVAKIFDFGLVRHLQPDGDVALTGDNVIAGTPLFLSPEAVASPEAVDARSDLYALAAVGYALLCGRNVFEGRTVVEICSHHLHTPPVPPSHKLGRPLPGKLEALVMRCLAKDPALRPQTARELREALEACDDVAPWSEEAARAWWAARSELAARKPAGEGMSPDSLSHAPTHDLRAPDPPAAR